MNQSENKTISTHVVNIDPGRGLFNPAEFQHMGTIAQVLVDSAVLPDHLRGKVTAGTLVEYKAEQQHANALIVVNAARLWKIDPFTLARSSYIVGNKLDFEGKVYAGLVHSHTNLVGRLRPTYEGQGEQMRCTITGRFSDEAEPRTVTTPTVKQCSQYRDRNGNIKTRDAWKNCDPEQQLFYDGVRVWVRRHCPELLLGVTTADEAPPLDEPVDHVIDAQTAAPAASDADFEALLKQIEAAETMDELRACASQVEALPLSDEQRQEANFAGRLRRDAIQADIDTAKSVDQRGELADRYAAQIDQAERAEVLESIAKAIAVDPGLEEVDRQGLMNEWERRRMAFETAGT